MPEGQKIQWRRGTAAAWTAANPVLSEGTPGFESDTGKFKVGDGVKDWKTLAYQGVSTLAALTDVKPVGLAVGTAVDAAAARLTLGAGVPLSELHTTFRGKPDGAAPAKGDDGVAVTIREVPSLIKDGLLQSPNSTGTPTTRASYFNQPLAGVKRIGASFKFSAGTGVIQANLVLWSYPIPTLYKVPNSPLHLSILPSGWELTIWETGTPTKDAVTHEIGRGSFVKSLATDWNPSVPGSGTLHRAEAFIEGDTVFLSLPDGSTAAVTDPRVASIPATVACWEHYRPSATSGFVAFEDIWSGTGNPVAAVSSSEAARMVVHSEKANRPIYSKHEPTPAADVVVPAALTAIPGLRPLTITLPEGCTAVEIEATMFYSITAQAKVLLAVNTGTADLEFRTVIDSASFKGAVTYKAYRNKLTPRTSYTMTLKHMVIGTGATLKADAASGYAVSWKITPVIEVV